MTENFKLTPTQDLLLEVLIARYRLGESYWTFDSRHKKMLEALASLGLVTVMHGNVEYTVRASLTDLAVETYISDSWYVSPLSKQLTKLQETVKAYELIYNTRETVSSASKYEGSYL